MYQFYYAKKTERKKAVYRRNISELIDITAVRPQMWEEHCLECSAPLCFETCPHYIARSDGRCMRFANGYEIRKNLNGCCNQSARVVFRKWANMMTIIFPAMLSIDSLEILTEKNQSLGKKLAVLANSPLPVSVRWQGIRTVEYMRRRRLRHLKGLDNKADAFVFHGYSFYQKDYHLILEIYDDHQSVYKKSFLIKPGENLMILTGNELTDACNTPGNLVKVYPENDIEAELDILWCDFVKGTMKEIQMPAEQVKCVVWDLDNTLWDGVLIETSDESSIKLKEGVLNIIKALDERGIIQSIASKNDYETAWPVVQRLGIGDYFLYPQIHWNAKSISMRQIAKSLNIGIDSLALIDDSVFEREQVKQSCPMVRVYNVDNLDQLLEAPEFDVPVTEESRNRRSMYQAEAKRVQLMQEDNTDTVEFIRKCHLRMKIFTPSTDAEIERCYELTVRTNQLNMSGNKYDRTSFEQILSLPNVKSFAFSCRDDYGEYGIVGFGQYHKEEEKIVFTEFAMSCRVAGKYVESGLFAALLEREGVEYGEFLVKKTKKNILLRNTLNSIGFIITKENEQEIGYRFDSNLKQKDLVRVEDKEQ